MRDYHVHSNFSDDCFHQPLIEACIKAHSLGLKEIAFTEHLDIDYPTYKDEFQLDYEGYIQEVTKAQSMFPDLKILKSLELGMQVGISEKMAQYINDHHFDFILGSIHVVDKMDLFSGEFTKSHDSEAAYKRYFEYLLTCLKEFQSFQVLAHFDLIRRYGQFSEEHLCSSDSLDTIKEIFRFIISKGIGLEINTSGWRYGINDFLPSFKLMKLYRSLGGEIITFGSDSHRPEHIGFHFKEACDFAKEAGFKYYSSFESSKPIFHAIP